MAKRVAIVFFCLLPASARSAGTDSLVGGTSWLAWGLGLVCGIVLMVLTTLEWRRLPEQALTWIKAQRRNVRWAALSMASIAVLALY